MSNDSRHKVNDDLLIKFILNEAGSEERQQVDQWISESSQNRAYFDKLKTIWDISEDALTIDVDVNKAWANVDKRTSPNKRLITIRSLKFATRIAAVLLITLGIYYLWPKLSPTPDFTQFASNETMRIDTLPDGSIVHLNKASNLSYLADFNQKYREVTLEGEAFFEVSRNENKPFIIHAGEAQIKVLGTSFNVKAYPEQVEIEVEVETGKVELSQPKATEPKAVVLVKEELGILNTSTDELLKTQQDTEADYNWRDQRIVFDRASMKKVVGTLSEIYQVEIRIEESIKEQKITVSFTEQNIDEILDIITATLNLSVTQVDNHYEIKNNEN